jgi:hypothetical protein
MFIIPKHNTVSKGVRKYVQDILLKNHCHVTQNFYLHVFLSIPDSIRNLEGWVPICHQFMRRYFRSTIENRDIAKLTSANLLQTSKYDKKGKKSRKYSIPPTILKGLLEILFQDLTNCVPLSFREKPSKSGRLKYYDKHNNLRSDLIKHSILKVRCKMNLEDSLLAIADKMKAASFIESQNLVNSCYTDIHNIASVMRNANKNFGMAEYTPEYMIARTGRICELGGVQNLSKLVKKAAYSGFEDVFNYDIRSSQITALYQESLKIGIEASILKDYVNNPTAKENYARQIGLIWPDGTINTGAWKKCLMSLVFGASTQKYYGTPYKELKKHDGNQVDNLFENFLSVASPFIVTINQWYEKLPDYIELSSYNTKHGKYFRNSCGLKINLDTDENAKDKKFMSAFILQGLESAFIHHLTVMCEDNGYHVLSNEHDGLITEGEIPEDAIIRARKLSGFELAILENKGFE